MEIILYDCHTNEKKKILKTAAQPKIAKANNSWLKPIGFSLLFVSTIFVVYLASPFIIKELSYRLEPKASSFEENEKFKLLVAEKAESERLRREAVAKEAESYKVSTDFSIVIPKINAASKVIPNVDAANEKAYREALLSGVSHALGTGFPGSNQTIFLFAHSTDSPLNISRYNAVFYLLKNLEKDDQIIIFYTGLKYSYKVTDKFITTADDTKWLTDNDGGERLVLQTCWPPGTSVKRLIVIAKTDK